MLPHFSCTFEVMNFFRSLWFMRAVVFLLAFMVLRDTITDRDQQAPPDRYSFSQVVVKAAGEQSGDDWEGRFLGLEHNLCKAPVSEIELAIPFTILSINFSTVTSHFRSVPSELPSPPPRG
jgi:hypothetical protein